MRVTDITNPAERQVAISGAAYSCASPLVLPAARPPSAEVEPDELGCPVLSHNITTAFGVDQWRFVLNEGQVISYDLNANRIFSSFQIIDPSGALVVDVFEAGDEAGRLTIEVTGEYLIKLESDRGGMRYSMRVADLST